MAVEKPDVCGKGEFIWCCAEFEASQLELQQEEGEGNVAEFQRWAPQVAGITDEAVSKATTLGSEMVQQSSANKSKASGDAAKTVQAIVWELGNLSSAYQVAIQLCATSKLIACESAGAGGIY